MIKSIKKIIVFLGFAYVLVGGLLAFFQEKLLFHPNHLPKDYSYSFSHDFEEFSLTSRDGAVLNTLHFKVENPKGVILYFHGNAGDLSRWGHVASYFVQYQYDVLVMDYRTYGKSTGKLSEKMMYQDAKMFYNYTKNRYSEENIIVYGRSLGTTFATYVAAKNNPKMLVLETPFTSITDVAKSRFPIYPIKWLLNYRFNSEIYISKVRCPVTIFHGTEDRVVPYRFGKKLFEKIEHSGKELITIPGGNHNNLIDFEEYTNRIEELLQ